MAIDAKIRSVIDLNGYIKIDEMMREVLSINPSSYYRATAHIGAKGDFITAPEISQTFGETIALWAIEQWQRLGRPSEFVLAELGPGQGTLMNDLLRASRVVKGFFEAARIYLLEINNNFINKQRSKLKIHEKEITWINKIEDIPALPTIIIANEFFDALPIKQFIKLKKKWYESVLITDPLDGRIKYSTIEIHNTLAQQFEHEYINANDGAIIEESIESLDIVRLISDHIHKHSGSALIIDYGYDIYPKERSRNQYNATLQAVKDHKYWPIIDSLGEADLTAHVDFNALRKASVERKIKDFKNSTQREFLLKYGIEIRLSELQKLVNPEEGAILYRQVERLIAPHLMGELFKVLEIYKVS